MARLRRTAYALAFVLVAIGGCGAPCPPPPSQPVAERTRTDPFVDLRAAIDVGERTFVMAVAVPASEVAEDPIGDLNGVRVHLRDLGPADRPTSHTLVWSGGRCVASSSRRVLLTFVGGTHGETRANQVADEVEGCPPEAEGRFRMVAIEGEHADATWRPIEVTVHRDAPAAFASLGIDSPWPPAAHTRGLRVYTVAGADFTFVDSAAEREGASGAIGLLIHRRRIVARVRDAGRPSAVIHFGDQAFLLFASEWGAMRLVSVFDGLSWQSDWPNAETEDYAN